jgi:uncharacterized protein involved in exopolysaccharide biosynthesis
MVPQLQYFAFFLLSFGISSAYLALLVEHYTLYTDVFRKVQGKQKMIKMQSTSSK